jgi:hypothetical protein
MKQPFEYVHNKLNQEVTAIGGHYMLTDEVVLSFKGKEILYLKGYAAFDTTCCGAGGCGYALVEGIILERHHIKNERDEWVSKLELISDMDERKEIEQLIRKKEMVQQVVFQ